jgi:hypothetical protein
MIKQRPRLLSHLRGAPTYTAPASWPTLHGRTEPREPVESEESGESGPVTPGDLWRFRENPDAFVGDARFVGHRGEACSEDFG